MELDESRIAQPRPIHILFIGAGAVGCFYGSRLHRPEANVFVSLVCRSNYDTIARDGVQLKTHTFGDYQFSPRAVYPSIQAAAEADNAPNQGWDYVVVTTKALPDVTDDSKDIEPIIKQAPEGRSCIVLIQNGVGIEEPHRKRFPKNPIVTAVTIVSAEQISHGVVKQNRWTRISMGPYSDGLGGTTPATKTLVERATRSTKQLVKLFTEHGKLRDAEEYDEVGILLVRWHKICINAAMNPSAVLAGGVGNADMVTDTELRTHLRGCMEEVFEAAPAILGREFPAKLAKPEQILKSTERNTGGKPSMLVDWEHGRPMELEVILGNPVRIARRHGVDLMRLQSLYALLRSAQRLRDERKKQEVVHEPKKKEPEAVKAPEPEVVVAEKPIEVAEKPVEGAEKPLEGAEKTFEEAPVPSKL
ncbi:2-dehydropantoate 2-reductase [Eremomyces bilateralis CBS 781.70]|uniref:2-dehydropantoate 2-reductase n=1 Tax=Eremomyces bilateralis CBS 781.70 TaxID=1392243 RepID=A0A6G1GHZ0_9PEZI|nr:2-dehydropantoate 2-reductase [Eremomyces bilateralis CBS 781.70]KAF1817511.1 2-dehydropantoate 2-reductase [Eremomyces bilateralis CBS 781.70]